MDYKELIKQLREQGATFIYGAKFSDTCIEAAAAIETLLAERDALIEELRGICWCCSHGKKYENGLPWSKATTCEHMRELGVVARSGGKCKCPHWEWRGPQKGGDGDG